MFDIRPVAYVIGLMVACLGATMLLPMLVDWSEGRGEWPVFLESAIITMFCGGLIALACANAVQEGLSIRQTFFLTTGVWVVLPIFGALPFVFGETQLSYTDAVFEAMSGLTTTGSTVLTGLEDLPKGLLLWRGLLQWLGGVGIIVVAMVFLPELRVGGMQIFRTESFETFGKILPRATQISSSISTIYITLTLACAGSYIFAGMNPFDATVHAMTTVATGGFSNYDTSFGGFGPAVEYVAVIFMILAALPFVRYVQLSATRDLRAVLVDRQIRGFMLTALVLTIVMVLWRALTADIGMEAAFRRALFNLVSVLTGTGYASEDYGLWGPFAVLLFFFVGLIGGCAGSTACSVKIFRYQLLFASIKVQLARIRSPHGVFLPRYDGRPIDDMLLSSVISFFVIFTVTLGVLSVALSLTGLDFITSVSGAATAIANIGPGLGPEIGPAGNFAGLNDTAKWILSFAMLAGRLELLVVFALFTPRFWRDG